MAVPSVAFMRLRMVPTRPSATGACTSGAFAACRLNTSSFAGVLIGIDGGCRCASAAARFAASPATAIFTASSIAFLADVVQRL